MRHAIASVQNNASCAARSVQGHHSLHGHIEGRHVEMLKENLRHLFSVLQRIHWRLSDEQRVFLRHAAQLIVKAMVPYLRHVVPVGHNTVLERISGQSVTKKHRRSRSAHWM
jgi:hypothetical protein